MPFYLNKILSVSGTGKPAVSNMPDMLLGHSLHYRWFLNKSNFGAIVAISIENLPNKSPNYSELRQVMGSIELTVNQMFEKSVATYNWYTKFDGKNETYICLPRFLGDVSWKGFEFNDPLFSKPLNMTIPNRPLVPGLAETFKKEFLQTAKLLSSQKAKPVSTTYTEEKPEVCKFCSSSNQDKGVIYESKNFLVKLNPDQGWPGRTFIIFKHHISRPHELSEANFSELFQIIHKLKQAIQETICPETSIFFAGRLGNNAFREQDPAQHDHFHFHIVPHHPAPVTIAGTSFKNSNTRNDMNLALPKQPVGDKMLKHIAELLRAKLLS